MGSDQSEQNGSVQLRLGFFPRLERVLLTCIYSIMLAEYNNLGYKKQKQTLNINVTTVEMCCYPTLSSLLCKDRRNDKRNE